jgi:hypothetical protein
MDGKANWKVAIAAAAALAGVGITLYAVFGSSRKPPAGGRCTWDLAMAAASDGPDPAASCPSSYPIPVVGFHPAPAFAPEPAADSPAPAPISEWPDFIPFDDSDDPFAPEPEDPVPVPEPAAAPVPEPAAAPVPEPAAAPAPAPAPSLPPPTPPPPPPPPPDLPAGFLRRVNDLRSAHGVPALSWDYALADYASRWAEKAYNYAGGPLVHSGGPYGENIFVTYAPDIEEALTQAARAWYEEWREYSFRAPGFTAGHFTALVWRATARVGVGWSRRPDGAFVVVASFDPPGNVEGLYADNVFPTASETN